MKNIYPSLLESGNIITSNSWFDIKEHKNESYNKKKKKKNIIVDYIDTIKIKLELNQKQKDIILKWLDDCSDVYNMTNEYLKTILDNNNYKKILNFINLRKILNESIRKICKINNLNKNSLKGYLLIEIRNKHVIELAKIMLDPEYNIIPLEYIDEKIRIDCIRKNIECNINYDNRLEILTNIFLKECTKETSKIISELCK